MVHGVGINDMPVGWRRLCEWNKLVYNKWAGMFERCYCERYQKKKPTYKECYVCNRWIYLSNFVEDFEKIDGYDKRKFLNGELVLDKDIKSDNQNKCYCLEQCLLVSVSENSRQACKNINHNDENYKQKISTSHPKRKKVAQYDLQENLIKVWSCIMDIERELKIGHGNIVKCCRGSGKTAGGYIWKYYEEDDID